MSSTSLALRRVLTIVIMAFTLGLCGLAAWKLQLRDQDRPVDLPAGASATIGKVHFGGPDQPPGALRSLLLRKVRQSPSGSSIDWATYYFLDQELAQALIDASDRGVKVTLSVEGDPRHGPANRSVVALLKAHGLGGRLTVRSPRLMSLARAGKLHSKIYAFSHPSPVALIGSFNPSGGDGVDPATIAAIGDQDRGHNLLVEIAGNGLVQRLVEQVRLLSANGGAVSRFGVAQNTVYRQGGTRLYFYPRLRTRIIEEKVDELGPGDRIWAAISHLKSQSVTTLVEAAERGVKLNLIVHHSERRVPEAAIRKMQKAGIVVRRYRHPRELPMHAKFFLIEKGSQRISYFGSLNLNLGSRLLNDEVLARSLNPKLFATLRQRYDLIEREVARQQQATVPPRAN